MNSQPQTHEQILANRATIAAAAVALTDGKIIIAWTANEDDFRVYDVDETYRYRVGCPNTDYGASAKMRAFTGKANLYGYVPTPAIRRMHQREIDAARESRKNGKHPLLHVRYLNAAAHARKALARRLNTERQALAAA
jgi:hypothetical protein